jgi:hypothetical protein
MVNFGKFFFGAGGRGVDPNSVRQLTLKCKGEGKVYDKATGECRDKKRPGRKNVGPLLKDLMADCKARGKVLDRATKECRDKKPRGNLEAARAARAAKLALAGPLMKDLMADCKARGKVFDRATKECREKKPRGNLEAARAARAAKLALAGPLIKDLMAECKRDGKVFDRATKECRDKKPRGRKADSQVVFFGVMPPPSHFRQAVQYHSPASKLLVPDYGALGRVVNPTGPASMMVASSIASPEMKFSVGMKKPALAAKAAKA